MQKKDYYTRWTKEQINEMVAHHRNGLTFSEIAQQFNLSRQRIQQLFMKIGYKPTRRNRSSAPRKYKYPILEKDQLVKYYIDEELSALGIAQKLNIPYNQVRKSLIYHKFQIRKGCFYHKTALTYEMLEKLYLKDAMTAREIADRLGYSMIAVAKRLSELGIKKPVALRRYGKQCNHRK